MPYTPENNPVKIDAALEEKIRTAPSAEHIAQYLREAYVEQNLAQTDEFNPEHFTPQKLAESAPTRFAKRVDGQIFEANSEQEVDRAIADYMRSKIAQPEARTEVTRDDKGRFTTERAQGRADENAVAKVELDLKFKRDQISTEEYLTQSGAIESYLEQQGIPLDILKEVAAERSDTRLVQSWQETTTEFLRSAGADWPGGGRENVNLKRIGDIIQQQGWVDEPDKVGVLAAAYQHLKQNGMLDTSHIDAERRLREARTPEEIRDAAVALRGGDSTIWGG